jgi:hypothetical protein
MNKRLERDSDDRAIIPAETAARIEREGEDYKVVPEQDASGFDTSAGTTVDGEGLTNNYAIEPEMYYEVPGDRSQMIEEEEEARRQELHEINETDEDGKLTLEADRRGRGVGII